MSGSPAPKRYFVVPGVDGWLVVYQVPGLLALQAVCDCRTRKGADDEAWNLNGRPQMVVRVDRELKRNFSEQMPLC